MFANVGLRCTGCMRVGLLFGNDESIAMQTAVRYEIEKHNNSTSTVFRLDRYEKSVDAGDSFDVCKACEFLTAALRSVYTPWICFPHSIRYQGKRKTKPYSRFSNYRLQHEMWWTACELISTFFPTCEMLVGRNAEISSQAVNHISCWRRYGYGFVFRCAWYRTEWGKQIHGIYTDPFRLVSNCLFIHSFHDSAVFCDIAHTVCLHVSSRPTRPIHTLLVAWRRRVPVPWLRQKLGSLPLSV